MAVLFDSGRVTIPAGTRTWNTPLGVADNVTAISIALGMWPKAPRSLRAVFETFDGTQWSVIGESIHTGGGDPTALMIVSFRMDPGTGRDVRLTTTIDAGGALSTSVTITSVP